MASSRNGANKTQRPIAFLVPGQRAEQPFAPPAGGAARGAAGTTVAATPGALKGGVRLSAQRGGGELHRLEAMPGEDVVALHIAGGPVLWLHPETARDLLRAQSRDMPTRAARGARAEHDEDATEVTVAAQLRWHGLERAAPTRGWMGDVVLAAIEVFTGRSGLKEKAVDLVASQALRLVDGQVDAGLYALEPTSLEARLKGNGRRLATLPAADGPALVLIHGTFVETTSTFKKLWTEHPRRVRELFARYGGHIYALDHPTMGASPIANALNPDLRGNPVARVFADDLAQMATSDEFPLVGTSYRLTEHFHFWTKHNPVNAALQPEFFVEISEELAAEKGITKGGMVRVWSKRGEIWGKAVVTKRIKPLICGDKTVHVVGMPIHWGFMGAAKKGFGPNMLTPYVGDANIETPEFKAFLVNIEPADKEPMA